MEKKINKISSPHFMHIFSRQPVTETQAGRSLVRACQGFLLSLQSVSANLWSGVGGAQSLDSDIVKEIFNKCWLSISFITGVRTCCLRFASSAAAGSIFTIGLFLI